MTKKALSITLTILFILPVLCLAQEVEVTSVWVKWERRGLDKYSFEAEIQVGNDTDVTYRVLGNLIFYDRSGYVIKRAMFSGNVEARNGATLIARGKVPIHKYKKIASHEATILSTFPIRRLEGSL